MSPLAKAEVNLVREISGHLHRWADGLDRHAGLQGDAELGPAWPERDLVELYDAWLETGRAIRDVARSQPDAAAADAREQLRAIRDGIRRIADIVERQT